VLNSWLGYPNLTYAQNAAKVGQGTITAGTLTTSWTPANSDKAYLMWRTPTNVDALP